MSRNHHNHSCCKSSINNNSRPIKKYVKPNIKELFYPGSNITSQPQNNHNNRSIEPTQASSSSSVVDLIQMKAMKMKVHIRNHVYNATVNTSRRVTSVNLQVGQFIVGSNPRLYDVLNSLMEVDGKTEDVPFIVVPEQGEKMIIGSQFLEIFGLKLNISWKAPVHQRVGQRGSYRGNGRGDHGRHHESYQHQRYRQEFNTQHCEKHDDDNDECLQIHLTPAEKRLIEFD